MPRQANDLILRIDRFTPETIPMDRLAKYMDRFAALLGSETQVHFIGIKRGSCCLVARAEDSALPKIRERVKKSKDGAAPRGALRALSEVDDLLAEDNAVGEVLIGEEKVIEFPGRSRPAKEEIGPVTRKSTIDGQIFSIGGKDETINVHLRNGDREFRCVVSVDLARKLGSYLLAGMIRLSGQGQWYRSDGVWRMASFAADSFVPLDESPLNSSLERIRGILSGVSPAEFMESMEELRNG